MEDLVHNHAKRGLLSVPIGVIYISNTAFSSVINFNFNQYFPKVVDIALSQLTLDDYYIVPIPVKIDITNPLDPTQLKNIRTILERYGTIKYFLCSAPTSYIDVLFEAFFRYEHDRILMTTGSSQIGADYADNVIRALPNDYPTINFIANLNINPNRFFDLIFLPGQFINNNQTLGYDAIASDIQIFQEYLASVGSYMLPNPYDPTAPVVTGLPSTITILNTKPFIELPNLGNPDGVSRTECIERIKNTLDSTLNPNYYTTNYYGSILMQYQQNEEAAADPTFLKDYPFPEVINWILITSYVSSIQKIGNEFKPIVDPTKISYLGYLLYYLTYFDYTSEKDILLVLAQYSFPPILAAINYYLPIFGEVFGVPNLLENFRNRARIILTNVNNRDEYSYKLFTDPRTALYWYNTDKTWYDLSFFLPTKIYVARTEQIIFVMLDKMSQQLNLRINGKYYDISNTTQPSINALYNALTFINHFVKNNIDIADFVLAYFLNTNLLQFGNNMLFNNRMDNYYDVTVGTTFFYSGEGVIGRNLRSNPAQVYPCCNQCNVGNPPGVSTVTLVNDPVTDPDLQQNILNRKCECPGWNRYYKESGGTVWCWRFETKQYWDKQYSTECPRSTFRT